jgi:hypothetical protein
MAGLKEASAHFHFTAHVSAPSRLRASVQSGATCWIKGPVGTEKVKDDEYSNLQYFACVALSGQATNWAGDSIKWWFAAGWLLTICLGAGTSVGGKREG